jgi:plasmid maintenance system killer protein
MFWKTFNTKFIGMLQMASKINKRMVLDKIKKYSKFSNSLDNFESNRISQSYSIRFELSNIRTALPVNSAMSVATCTW